MHMHTCVHICITFVLPSVFLPSAYPTQKGASPMDIDANIGAQSGYYPSPRSSLLITARVEVEEGIIEEGRDKKERRGG